MNRLVMTFAALLGLLGLRAAERDFTQYVNPLMGTQSSFELSAGNTYPVTALPWGMNFWTPQTGKMGDGWQYTYTANRIRGFKQTHQPSPWINDFGQFSLMPVTGSPEFDEDRRASWFSHKGETSRPYYYKVYLAEHDVVAEMAPTERAALFRFTFPETEQVHVRVASSFISSEQAELNLKELGDAGLEELAQQGRDRWNEVLGRVEVEGGTLDQYRTFYTCLYRSLLFPHKFHEVDARGKTVHYSPTTGQVLPGYYYTGTGLWDTFRCLFPLLNLMYPSVSREMQEGFLNAYRESGFFPEWSSPGHRDCMVGNNSASVLADAYLKGICVDDTETLWNGLMAGAGGTHPTVSSSGRLGYEYYNRLGYIPYDVKINENAARTLEYAYDDWCIYRLGRKLGRPEKELEVFARRAMNYRNLFDPETRLMRGRNQDGTFMKPFSPLKWGDAFTEGNSWHYTWSVFHDPQGLISLMGGKDSFVQMLDSVFHVPPLFDDSYYGQVIHEIREMTVMNMGNYAHGNQPIQHMIYLYDYAGQPWKAQYWLRQVMDRLYTPAPDGYCGDEDNGQTSAWYVFSALGFYPVCPGTDQYVLGAPLFRKALLHFENGNVMEIAAPGNSPANYYLNRMLVNGKEHTANYLEHAVLQQGGRIECEMSATPNLSRGILENDLPYSFSRHPEE